MNLCKVLITVSILNVTCLPAAASSSENEKLLQYINSASLLVEGAMKRVLTEISRTSDLVALEAVVANASHGTRITAFRCLHDYPLALQQQALAIALRSDPAWKEEMWSESAIGRRGFVDAVVSELARHGIKAKPEDLESLKFRHTVAAKLDPERIETGERVGTVGSFNTPITRNQGSLKVAERTENSSARASANLDAPHTMWHLGIPLAISAAVFAFWWIWRWKHGANRGARDDS